MAQCHTMRIPHARYPSPRRSSAQITESGISLAIVSFCTMIGVIIAQTPITNIRLKILDPTTLLTASSLLCTNDAVTLTAVSGRDVPIATIVSPMMIEGTFSFFAMLELPSTKKICSFDQEHKTYDQKHDYQCKRCIIYILLHEWLLSL